jgi:glycosyltransferase involved in cell wall biosynthesis
MIAAGLPTVRVHVKPNFYPGIPETVPWTERKPYVVYAGRLSTEKGVGTLIHAWLLWGPGAPELRVAGDGPLRKELEGLASTQPLTPIRFLGQLTGDVVRNEIAFSRLVVLPSKWFEGFPMVVQEAFAFATPMAVSNIGPLPDIVKHGVSGLVFEPGNPVSLLNHVKSAWEAHGVLENLGSGARTEFVSKYTQEKNYNILMEIYGKAIIASPGKSGEI